MPSKLWIVLLLNLGCMAHFRVQAQNTWFTVSGDADDKAANVIRVDPVPRTGNPDVMRVRVSRSMARTSWDGVPYRSYEADVLFDCRAGTARYMAISYFAEPLWEGAPVRTVDYTGIPRMMEFREVQPNPTQRIVSAACQRQTKR